ncbi:CHRD domain-containing protein [Chitinophaga varians]|uniref:CHRD domain-containing protein n=1 Tax=Chitinophaga varians TaxID=2202339 RepID=UPI00165ECB9C|nr:CHRD domain-containing protein [Chitinophaga varians]MBC9908997.1 CHRD domain-containing protein [Chitinophaga varians]
MKKISFSRRWRSQMLAYSSLLFGAVWMTACNDSYNNSNPGDGNTYTISASLTGGQETPPNASTGTGTLTGTYDPATYKLTYKITWNMISGAPTGMHFHGPAAAGVAAPVVVGITGFPTDSTGSVSGSVVITAGQAGDLLSGNWYVNIHTAKFPNGEIRGQVVTSKMTSSPTPGY